MMAHALSQVGGTILTQAQAPNRSRGTPSCKCHLGVKAPPPPILPHGDTHPPDVQQKLEDDVEEAGNEGDEERGQPAGRARVRQRKDDLRVEAPQLPEAVIVPDRPTILTQGEQKEISHGQESLKMGGMRVALGSWGWWDGLRGEAWSGAAVGHPTSSDEERWLSRM
jgi:hypothetical protein